MPEGKRGFTFVELLAAMLFMAIVIPAALRGIAIANRSGVLAERKRTALALADDKLTETVITRGWLEGDQEGEFEDDSEFPQSSLYRWSFETGEWEEDSMRLLTVTVFYTVQQREYSVTLSTVVDTGEEAGE